MVLGAGPDSLLGHNVLGSQPWSWSWHLLRMLRGGMGPQRCWFHSCPFNLFNMWYWWQSSDYTQSSLGICGGESILCRNTLIHGRCCHTFNTWGVFSSGMGGTVKKTPGGRQIIQARQLPGARWIQLDGDPLGRWDPNTDGKLRFIVRIDINNFFSVNSTSIA